MTSNTQVGLFTRVPRSIEKKWTCKIVNSNGETLANQTTCDVSSPVDSVELIVSFKPQAITTQSVFNEADDTSNDRMSFVQQQRKLYGDLETAVQSVINEYSNRLIELAQKQQSANIEIPNKRTITYSVAAEQTSADRSGSGIGYDGEQYTDHRSFKSPTVGSRVRTLAPSDIILPNDSVSVTNEQRTRYSNDNGFSIDQLARVLQEAIDGERRGRRAEKKRSNDKRQRSASRARTILSSATGYETPRVSSFRK